MFFGLFGWNWKVRRMRKKWDRLREKTLRKKEPIRSEALQKLDTIAPTLVTLEERQLNRVDRARMSKEVQIDLAEIQAILK